MTTLTIIFAILAIIFLVLFCVSNATARSLESERDEALRRLKGSRESEERYDAKLRAVMADLRGEKQQREDAESELNHYMADVKRLTEMVHQRTKLCGIKFTANIPLTGWTKTEFKLGVGPCGKEVISIQLIEKPDHYIVTQWCTDGERKEFEYKKEDVAGRIERAYRPYKKQ